MGEKHLPDPSADNRNFDVDEILEQHDAYIVGIARKNVPRNLVHPDVLKDEIEENAQRVRVKYWRESQRQHIRNPRAYMRRVAYTETMDLIHDLKLSLPLSTDHDGELNQGSPLMMLGEGMQNPAEIVEQAENFAELIQKMVAAILLLPPRERLSFIWFLKREMAEDRNTDLLPLIEALKEYGCDIEAIDCKADSQEEIQRFRSLLSVVRKKLRLKV